MPSPDDRQEFFKDFQGRKVQRADQLRKKVAAKAPAAKPVPSPVDAELRRLRKENADLRAKAMQARSEAAAMLGRAGRMAQVPPHVVKDFSNKIMRILGG